MLFQPAQLIFLSSKWVTSTLDILQLFNSAQEDYREVQNVDSKNVHLITSMEKWEAKLLEATQDGKIVSLSPSIISFVYVRMASKLFLVHLFITFDI